MANYVKKKKKFNTAEFIFLFSLLLIPIAHFLVFWLYVNFDSILMAFQYKQGGEVKWGFYNYTRIWADMTGEYSTFWSAFKNTMYFFFSNLFLTLPVSLVLCYFFFKKIWGYKVFRFVFYLPSIIAGSVYVVLFKYLIATNGLLGTIMDSFGVEFESLLFTLETSLPTILAYSILTSFGGNIILLGGAMNHIDVSIMEAARLDGCDMWTEVTKIVMPLIWPTLSTLIVFAFVGFFSASGPILLFLNDKASDMNANTLSFWIFSQVYFNGEYYYPASVGIILTTIGYPVALLVKWLVNKVETVEM